MRWADQWSRGALPSVVCLSVIMKLREGGGLGFLGLSEPRTEKKSKMRKKLDDWINIMFRQFFVTFQLVIIMG